MTFLATGVIKGSVLRLTGQGDLVSLLLEDRGVVILVSDVDCQSGERRVRRVRGSNTQHVRLPGLEVKSSGQGDSAAEAVDAERRVRVAALGERVSESRVRVHVIGCDLCHDRAKRST